METRIRFPREDHGAAPTGGKFITYSDPEEKKILAALNNRTDFEALRLKRLLALPDLTRADLSPIRFILDRILTISDFQSFDVVTTPEIVAVEHALDLFNFPPDHPSRSSSDTYFVSEKRILRTHTTSMWFYYLTDPAVRRVLEDREWVGELCYGKVYRKDEIDSRHFPVFHQIDGLYLRERSRGDVTLSDLKEVLANIVKSVFGKNIVYRFLDDSFPFTDPSTQVEIRWNDAWLEVVGAGIVHGAVLKNLGFNSEEYSGWAFGFGLERLAMIRNAIPDIRIFWSEDSRITKQFTSIESQFHEVSKYPPVIRDISFVVSNSASPNRFYEIVRHSGGGLVEEVGLTDEYEDAAKFGVNAKSYTFRVVYRSHERTLTNSEVNDVHHKIEQLVASELGARIR